MSIKRRVAGGRAASDGMPLRRTSRTNDRDENVRLEAKSSKYVHGMSKELSEMSRWQGFENHTVQ